MRSFNILQYLMTDSLSLQAYRSGRSLSIKVLSDNLYEQMRASCCGVPGHFIADGKKDWLWLDDAGREADQLRDVFIKLLPKFASSYMDEENDNIYLNQVRTTDWQMVVQMMSPLLMVGSVLYHKHPVNIKSDAAVRDLLLANTQHTALPSVHKHTLDKYGGDGVRDLHIHLSAMMEADRAVLSLMRNPRRILNNHNSIADITIHACGYVDRDEINKDISRLCRLEYLLAEKVFAGRNISKCDFNDCICGEDFRYERSDDILDLYVKGIHSLTDLQFEALLIHRSLFGLSKESGSPLTIFTKTFHAYLLLFGRLRSFGVMQQGDAGLMGLNRYLGFGIRGESQNISLENFMQLVGNTSHHIRYIDLRLGVLSSAEIMKLKSSEEHFNTRLQPLVSRFVHVALIAKKDDKSAQTIRNEELRRQILNSFTPALCSADGKTLYSAVDVAGRDYEVHPDVFAGLFDELRDAGYGKFTYHAGEDFYHLLGGLRAIYEAVTFLKLGEGCRIGHACAAGVAPHLWSDMLGGEIKMKKGEYLDDLIFTLHFVSTRHVAIPQRNKNFIKKRIEALAQDVYGRATTVQNLTEAWLKRVDDPKSYVYSPTLDVVGELVADYHNKDVRERYDDGIVVNCYEALNESHMIKLQKSILELLADKGIAIETMPTSNVYIGLHQSFHSYHLKQWIDWKFCRRYKCRMPAIVIGSDEPGILCTNIMIEYAHICNMLESAKDMLLPKKQIPNVLHTLATDARRYEFT